MSQVTNSIPANDPDQFVVAPVDKDKLYLGNATVVHKFTGDFANEVMRAYGGFLAGTVDAFASQQQINALIKEYGEAFMGRDPLYEIAPWQGRRLRAILLVNIDGMTADDDPGHAFFKHLALLCVKCSIGLINGFPREEVGDNLQKILAFHRKLMLGI
jgi:hypothetical protein